MITSYLLLCVLLCLNLNLYPKERLYSLISYLTGNNDYIYKQVTVLTNT